MRHHRGTHHECSTRADPVGILLDAELPDVGQSLVKAALIPEVFFGAADARVPRLDRERRTLVPAHRGAGVVCRRALAAHLVEAVSLARIVVVESFDELPRVEMRSAIALVVDALTVERLGPSLTVEV